MATLQRGFDLPLGQRRLGDIPIVASNGIVGTHDTPKVKGPGVVTGRSGTIGKVFYWKSDFWPLNTTLYVKDFHGNDPKFVAYLLEHLGLKRFAASTGVPSLNRNFIHPLQVTIPPLPEQRKIAAILAAVEEMIEKSGAVISALTSVCRSLLEDLFAPRVGRQWPSCSLESLCTRIVDGVHRKPVYVPQGIPFVTVKNLTTSLGISLTHLNYITEHDHRQFTKRANPEVGDVLISKDGTLGVPRVVETTQPFSIFVSVALLKPRKELIDSYFLRYALESPAIASQFRSSGSGSALRHIHLVDLRRTQCPVPPIGEQRAIARGLRTLDERLSAEQNYSQQLRLMKDSLARTLLAGQLRVTPDEAAP